MRNGLIRYYVNVQAQFDLVDILARLGHERSRGS